MPKDNIQETGYRVILSLQLYKV